MKKGLVTLLTILLIGLFSDSYKVLANEGDDSLTQANLIEINQTISGKMEDYGDMDFYKFTTPADGMLNISMANISDTGWAFKMYDQSGEEFKWTEYTDSSELAQGSTNFGIGLPKGTYYLKVIPNTGEYLKVPYMLQVKFTEGNLFEKENNDDLSNANVMVLNQTYKAHAQYDNDPDFYKFTTPSNGQVTVSIENKSKYGWTYQLYDNLGKEFNWDKYTDESELAKGNRETSVGLPAGTYYLKIADNNYGNSGVPYAFQVKFKAGEFFEQETNDDISHSNQIVLNQQYQSQLQQYSDKDFFKFVLPSISKVSISISNQLDISWRYQVYTTTGKETSLNGNTDYSNLAKDSTQTTVTLPAGEYYLKMEGNSYPGDPSEIPYYFKVAASSVPLNLKQVTIVNGKGSNDSINIKNLKVGDVVKVYNSKGKLLATSKTVAKGQSSIQLKLPQIGTAAGQLKVSVTSPELLESNSINVPFAREK